MKTESRDSDSGASYAAGVREGGQMVAGHVLALLTSRKAAPVVVNGVQTHVVVHADDVRAAVRAGLAQTKGRGR